MSEPNVNDLLSLKGRVAVVTGAAGWLGSAMSRALAEAGARLVVTSRELAKAQAFAETLPGTGHIGMTLDLLHTETFAEFVRNVVDVTGQIDILVNNGYSGSAASIQAADADDFNRSYHAGVTGYFVLARDVANHMRSRGGGSIINIASMYGVVGSYPDAYEGLTINSPPSYHALKGALVHLTRHLAVYWAKDGIRVNAISPGPFPPQRVQDAYPTFIPRLEAKSPMGRMGQPHEVKGVAVLLASDAGSYITGQNILVDGGWTAW